jgi:hypothetical protein
LLVELGPQLIVVGDEERLGEVFNVEEPDVIVEVGETGEDGEAGEAGVDSGVDGF